jgi:hypothetical protein
MTYLIKGSGLSWRRLNMVLGVSMVVMVVWDFELQIDVVTMGFM